MDEEWLALVDNDGKDSSTVSSLVSLVIENDTLLRIYY